MAQRQRTRPTVELRPRGEVPLLEIEGPEPVTTDARFQTVRTLPVGRERNDVTVFTKPCT